MAHPGTRSQGCTQSIAGEQSCLTSARMRVCASCVGGVCGGGVCVCALHTGAPVISVGSVGWLAGFAGWFLAGWLIVD